MVRIQENIRECDVLIVGGGIGGLMAGITAADYGANVIIAEKCDTRRSGSGATGNDHFICYIPEVHECDIHHMMEEMGNSLVGGWTDTTIQRKFLEQSFETVKLWNDWGINMKPHGEWEFNGHAFPGRKKMFLKYDGTNQKEVLNREAKKRGIIFENKTAITEYLTDEDGKIYGAVGIDISQDEPSMVLFRTKAVISTTGHTDRLYQGCVPSQLFNTSHCPNNTGTGRAAAYRAGARLINMEIPATHAGPKYFERAGKATWIGIISDPKGDAIGPFVKKPTKDLGDITSDVWHSVFTDKIKDGTGPVYMNCTETPEEDFAYMMWGLVCEGDTSLIEALKDQNIDLKKEMVEFTRYPSMLVGRGIEIDEKGRTNVAGLYAAGDEIGNFRAGIAGAAVIGQFAGEDAANYSKTKEFSTANLAKEKVVLEAQRFYTSLFEADRIGTWQELNHGIQQILNDYASVDNVRSETLLEAGYTYLNKLEQRAKAELHVSNAHELMRALESFDLLLMGKLVCLTALERKETRGMHKRSDYPFTNPLLNRQFLTVQYRDGQPVMEWREMIVSKI